MRLRAKISALVLVLVLGGGILFYIQAQRWLYSPIEALTQSTVYEIQAGSALNGVLNELSNRKLIAHPRELSLWLRFARPGYTLKAGEYELQAGMTPLEVADLFSSGHVVLHSLTVVEGTAFAEFERELTTSTMVRASSPPLRGETLMRRMGSQIESPEGQFFPDTYRFPKGTADLEIYSLAYRRMHNELERAWNERDAGLPLANAYEALILASIVEKEAKLAAERPVIAGVFIERLRKGMRLETDPTVIYGMGASYDGNIHKADLRRDTPFNTYTRVGLPPTPICLPGLDSLRAAVHPQITGALFFVATGRSDGSHTFSKTYEEHKAAVDRYLRATR